MTKAARLLLCSALAIAATASNLQTWLPGGGPKKKVRMAATEVQRPLQAVA